MAVVCLLYSTGLSSATAEAGEVYADVGEISLARFPYGVTNLGSELYPLPG